MEEEKITPNEGEVKTAEKVKADIESVEEAEAEEEYEEEAKDSGDTEY